MITEAPPKIDNAPGLKWRRRRKHWVAEWQARTDLVRRGWTPKSQLLARIDGEISDLERAWISDHCNRLQSEMLVWGRGGLPQVGAFDGSLASLIRCYQTDPDSRYRKIRFHTRTSYDASCRRIDRDHGQELIRDIRPRQLVRWHEAWSKSGIPMAHSLMSMLRNLVKFGVSILEDDECMRVRMLLHDMKFELGQPRKEQITADQATAVRAKAHAMSLPSIALAQAFQFECTLRQKDVIGEWVPQSEPELSTVLDETSATKWIRGITWQEIGDDLVLRHRTSKKGKDLIANLRLAPMVMDELRLLAGIGPDEGLTRDRLPHTGPLILADRERRKWLAKRPWLAHDFRRRWRQIARAAGIPDNVCNMDSRAGAITEGLAATGGNLNAVKHAATHSNVSMTQRYDRSGAEIIEGVMEQRSRHRNKPRTDKP